MDKEIRDYRDTLLDLNLFANLNTNVTTDDGLSVEMKTFYDRNLIRLVGPELVHDQFAQKRPIPKHGGKTVEFRKYENLEKALTPLTEGVTPDGKKLTATDLTATISQYGDYITISDVLELTAIDSQLTEAQELLADQAGRTLDTVTREVMVAGTNVLYAGGKTGRAQLTTGDKLTVDLIRDGVRILKNANAKKIDGNYVAIIHPNVEYDLMGDPKWISAAEYAGSTQLFSGEIGKLYGVRFVETTEAKIFEGEGASSQNVYATMMMGQNFYGVTDIEGGGLQFIVKQKGSAGTADPLDQRATAGWKAIKTAERLVEQYGLRIETIAEKDPVA